MRSLLLLGDLMLVGSVFPASSTATFPGSNGAFTVQTYTGNEDNPARL